MSGHYLVFAILQTKKKLLLRKKGIQLNIWHEVFDSRWFEVPHFRMGNTSAHKHKI